MEDQTVGGVVLAAGSPRIELKAARCAGGLNKTGAGFRVTHRMSGLSLGIVAKSEDGAWRFYLSPSGVESVPLSSAEEAGERLADYLLDCALARVANPAPRPRPTEDETVDAVYVALVAEARSR